MYYIHVERLSIFALPKVENNIVGWYIEKKKKTHASVVFVSVINEDDVPRERVYVDDTWADNKK